MTRTHSMNSRALCMTAIHSRGAAVLRATALLVALTGAAACGGSSSAEETGTVAETPAAILGASDVATAQRADVAGGLLVTGTLQPADVVTIRAQADSQRQPRRHETELVLHIRAKQRALLADVERFTDAIVRALG